MKHEHTAVRSATLGKVGYLGVKCCCRRAAGDMMLAGTRSLQVPGAQMIVKLLKWVIMAPANLRL